MSLFQAKAPMKAFLGKIENERKSVLPYVWPAEDFSSLFFVFSTTSFGKIKTKNEYTSEYTWVHFRAWI